MQIFYVPHLVRLLWKCLITSIPIILLHSQNLSELPNLFSEPTAFSFLALLNLPLFLHQSSSLRCCRCCCGNNLCDCSKRSASAAASAPSALQKLEAVLCQGCQSPSFPRLWIYELWSEQ